MHVLWHSYHMHLRTHTLAFAHLYACTYAHTHKGLKTEKMQCFSIWLSFASPCNYITVLIYETKHHMRCEVCFITFHQVSAFYYMRLMGAQWKDLPAYKSLWVCPIYSVFPRSSVPEGFLLMLLLYCDVFNVLSRDMDDSSHRIT